MPVEQTRRLRECPWSPHTREFPSGHEENICRQQSYDLAVPVPSVTMSQDGYGRSPAACAAPAAAVSAALALFSAAVACSAASRLA